MEKLYIYFTKCTETYNELYNNQLYELEIADNDDEIYTGFSVYANKIAFIDSSLVVKENPSSEEDVQVLLIHDSLAFDEVPNEVKGVIESAKNLVVFFHRSNPNVKNAFLEWNKNQNIKYKTSDNEDAFSHIDNDTTNPFYRLSELWDCENKKAFVTKLQAFEETFFLSQEQIESEDLLEVKLNFLHKLLAKEEDKKLKEELVKVGYDKINYNKDNHIESVREIRDYLLSDTV